MNIFFLLNFIILIIITFVLAKTDAREGIIPDKDTEPSIYFFVIIHFIIYRGFTFEFYLYFTILVLLYIIFMCIQYALHYNKKTLGTGDIKLFLLIYAAIPFFKNAFANIPLFSIFLMTLGFAVVLAIFKLAYYSFLIRSQKMKKIFGIAVEVNEIRLAPLIFITLIIHFIIYLI